MTPAPKPSPNQSSKSLAPTTAGPGFYRHLFIYHCNKGLELSTELTQVIVNKVIHKSNENRSKTRQKEEAS